MKKLAYSLLIAFPVVCLAIEVAPAQSPANLKGTIKDPVGAVIARAFVVVHPDMAGLPSTDTRDTVTLTSDAKGAFTLDVKPGFYDVCAMASAFTPQCKKVHVKEGKISSQAFILRISPEVGKQIADTFPPR